MVGPRALGPSETIRKSLARCSATSGAARPLHGLRLLAQGGSSGDGSGHLAIVVVSVVTLSFAGGLLYLKRSGGGSAASRAVKDDDPPKSVDWTACVENLPQSIDWEALGAVNIPRDQGGCGSCWAHSPVGAIEAIHQITFKELLYLSVQCVIDCAERTVGDGRIRGRGCDGGQIEDAFEFVKRYGIATEKDYPRRWLLGHGKCLMVGKNVAALIHGYRYTQSRSEESLMRACARQPVAVAVDHFPGEINYKGDLIEIEEWPPAKDPKQAHVHTVLVVAYGTDSKGRKFWKIKNSRGKRWGDRGYAYLRRGGPNKDGVGGITRYNGIYPVINLSR